MSSVAYVEIYLLFGGTKLTQNLRAGEKYDFKDWAHNYQRYILVKYEGSKNKTHIAIFWLQFLFLSQLETLFCFTLDISKMNVTRREALQINWCNRK